MIKIFNFTYWPGEQIYTSLRYSGNHSEYSKFKYAISSSGSREDMLSTKLKNFFVKQEPTNSSNKILQIKPLISEKPFAQHQILLTGDFHRVSVKSQLTNYCDDVQFSVLKRDMYLFFPN